MEDIYNKPDITLAIMWKLMEDHQDVHPYLRIGWYGFSGWYMDI